MNAVDGIKSDVAEKSINDSGFVNDFARKW